MIETSSIAQPRLGRTSPLIPKRVLELAEQVRSGTITATAANRALGTRATGSSPVDPRRNSAIAGVNARLEKFRKSR